MFWDYLQKSESEEPHITWLLLGTILQFFLFWLTWLNSPSSTAEIYLFFSSPHPTSTEICSKSSGAWRRPLRRPHGPHLHRGGDGPRPEDPGWGHAGLRGAGGGGGEFWLFRGGGRWLLFLFGGEVGGEFAIASGETWSCLFGYVSFGGFVLQDWSQ